MIDKVKRFLFKEVTRGINQDTLRF